MWSANDEALINFGKHRGRRLSEVAAGEPDYLEWMAGTPGLVLRRGRLRRRRLDGEMPVRGDS